MVSSELRNAFESQEAAMRAEFASLINNEHWVRDVVVKELKDELKIANKKILVLEQSQIPKVDTIQKGIEDIRAAIKEDYSIENCVNVLYSGLEASEEFKMSMRKHL